MKKKLHQLTWDELTPYQRGKRTKSLNVISSMRTKQQSLTYASREVGIKPKTVRKYTHAVKKVRHRYYPKRYDKIPRTMRITSNGKEFFIEIRDSRHASLISRYHNAVKEFLETGDKSILEPFKGRRVKDSEGNWHFLETDPESIYETYERRADEEFYTIYRDE